MRRNTLTKALPYLASLLLLISPIATAQSGGTGVGVLDKAYADVEYIVNSTLNSTAPGNGTGSPGNGTSPPANNTNPPGNNPTPPGNSTNPPGNSTPGNQTGNPTAPPGNNTGTGNETVGTDGEASENGTAEPAANETEPEEASGNGTVEAGGNATIGAAWGSGGADEGCPSCDDDAAAQVTAQEIGSDGTDAEGEGAANCNGSACQRSRAITTPPPVKAGFPWLPLLITLTLAPLAGLFVARTAIRRWQIGKPTKKPAHVTPSVKGPADAHDPMRQFLLDVKEWRATPVPGIEPSPVVPSAAAAAATK